MLLFLEDRIPQMGSLCQKECIFNLNSYCWKTAIIPPAMSNVWSNYFSVPWPALDSILFDGWQMVSFKFCFSDYNWCSVSLFCFVCHWIANNLYHHLLCHLVFPYLSKAVLHIFRTFYNISPSLLHMSKERLCTPVFLLWFFLSDTLFIGYMVSEHGHSLAPLFSLV